MISQKARYALRALLYLAARGDTAPVQISEIAESENIPRKFLEQILLELKKPGIVRSVRGPLRRLFAGPGRQGYQLRRCAAGDGRAAGAQPLRQRNRLPALRRLF